MATAFFHEALRRPWSFFEPRRTMVRHGALLFRQRWCSRMECPMWSPAGDICKRCGTTETLGKVKGSSYVGSFLGKEFSDLIVLP